MTHVQPHPVRKYRPLEDPHLLEMMATHVHCGEVMQLVSAGQPEAAGFRDGKNDGGLLTYRCACGFSFDQELPGRRA